MASIVASAIAAGKYYKHVVHLIEQMIIKCTGNFQLSGLLIMDAVLRRSRLITCGEAYNFRFLRNIDLLFLALSKGVPDDKPLICKILEIWKKECLYPDALTSALQDLVDNSSNIEKQNSGILCYIRFIVNSSKAYFTIDEWIWAEAGQKQSGIAK